MDITDRVIRETENWVKTVVIDLHFCPFAEREFLRHRIHYEVICKAQTADSLVSLIEECRRLNSTDTIETTLLVFPDNFGLFDDFLELLDLAEQLMIRQGYEGIYQVASFHPDYCFADSAPDDPANYTNRSPYPMLHLLREASLEAALQHYDRPELIPANNIRKATAMGLEKMRALLKSCYQNGA